VHVARMAVMKNLYKTRVGNSEGDKAIIDRCSRRWVLSHDIYLKKQFVKVWTGISWLRVGS
jgi:hypothetical protein